MSKHYIVLFLTFLLTGALQAQPPVITSFDPAAAPLGGQVIITGNRFSAIADSNTVYFGTVRAAVSTATDTSLTVTVPAGSAYRFITVKKDTLTAFSRQPFVTSYGDGLLLRNSSFGDARTIAAAHYPCFGDFDGDGRVDMVAATNNNRIVIHKNTDSAGYPGFGAGMLYAGPTSPTYIIAADFNTDGRLDIAVAGGNAIWLYANTSIDGNISFAAPVYQAFSADTHPYTLDANDIDGDGKTDLVISFVHSGTCFSVARNNSSGGNITFATRVTFAFGSVPGGAGNVGNSNKIIVADMDGDGKPDVTSVSRFFPPFLIYRNTSTPGTVSFAPKTSIASNRNTSIGNGSFDMKLADMDGDGKPEILYASSDSSLLSVYKNQSTTGNIAFAPKLNFEGPYTPVFTAVNDLNGDGKVDVALLSGWDSLFVYQNNSVPGNVSFKKHRPYRGYNSSEDISLADMDADGKTDIVLSGPDANNSSRYKTHLLKNILDETVALPLCPITDSIVLEPGKSGIAYQWQVDTGNGFIDVQEDSNHYGSSSELLVLRNPPSSWAGYQYRCVVDGTNGAAQLLRFTAYWTGNFNNSWEDPRNWKCGQLPDENCDVVVNYGILTLNSNRQVRSITVKPGAIFTVGFGKSLTVTH